MLKKLINELQFTLKIKSEGPLLIKDGRYDSKKHDDPLDSVFVCHDSEGNLYKKVQEKKYDDLKFYIPGTSLRGVLRSHAEKIVRTVSPDENDPIVCNPFEDDSSCSHRLDNNKSEMTPYKNSCVICKLFGNTGTASRIHIYDGSISDNFQINIRDGIAIDRFTGGVKSGATFQNMVLENCSFESKIVIRNFELWQLGLLAYVLRDLEEEQLSIGFGKSKGFGKVTGKIENLILKYYSAPVQKIQNSDNPDEKNENEFILQGLSEISSDADNEKYGFVKIQPDSIVSLKKSNDESYFAEYKLKENSANGDIKKNPLWSACAKIWNESLKKKENGDYYFPTISQFKKDEDTENIDKTSVQAEEGQKND